MNHLCETITTYLWPALGEQISILAAVNATKWQPAVIRNEADGEV